MENKENILTFSVHESVYDDICVHMRIVFDGSQNPSSPILEWGIQVKVKQPKTSMQFAITAPYQNTWEEWRGLIHDGKSIELHESDMQKIDRRESNLVFISHPTDAVWSVPHEAICPALEAVLQEARLLNLTFFEEEEGELTSI